jgi:hypothetical protein
MTVVAEDSMKHQLRLAGALVGTFALAACSDTTPQQSITGVPSLNANGGQGTTHCEGTLPPGVYENIVVLPDAICLLNNSTIIRDVMALPRSSLVMVDDQVGGNIESHNATQVIVQGGTVGGGIRIKGGGFQGVAASINNVTVSGGDVQVENVEANILFIGSTRVTNGGILTSRNVVTSDFQIQFNTVSESIEVYKTLGPAAKIVSLNVAAVTVRCEGNEPPFVGGPNFAPEREGQCF